MIKRKSKRRPKVEGGRPQNPLSFLNAAELAEATKEFDAEFIGDRSVPLSAEDRKMFAKAKRVGRPTIGNGAKVISITVERSLLARLDAFAQGHGLSRASAVAYALNLMLGVTVSPTPVAAPAKPINAIPAPPGLAAALPQRWQSPNEPPGRRE